MAILLRIPKHSATVLHAWTPARMNQKEYVTCSSNVTHDGKITMAIFFTYPEALSNCIAWTSAWVNQKVYVTCSLMSRTTEK